MTINPRYFTEKTNPIHGKYTKLLVLLGFGIALLSCGGQSNIESANELRNQLDSDKQFALLWESYAQQTFIEEGQAPDIESFANTINAASPERRRDLLSDLVNTRTRVSSPEQRIDSPERIDSLERINSPERINSHEPARNAELADISKLNLSPKQRLQNKQYAMLYTHLASVCTTCFEITSANSEQKKAINSLRQLRNNYPELLNGQIEAYYANNETKVMAYSLQHGNNRAYVAFNFSFNIQEMPLPFGFMASTKVTVWQSDDLRTSTFVTQQKLMVPAFTAMIVFV
jgi:hypothetical protein